MASHAQLHIKGQAELERAFLDLRKDVFVGLKASLIEAGKAVSDESHQLIPGEASNIGDRWSQFKIGANVKGVWVAPKARRRRGSKRPNLADALRKSMEDALEQKKAQVVAEVNAMVDVAAAKNGFF